MKKITLKNMLACMLFFTSAIIFSQDNQVTIDPTGGGSEGNSKFIDEMTITVSASGVVSLPAVAAVDWVIDASNTGDINLTGAQDKTFIMNWKGMSAVNTTAGADLGALVTQGGIDRATTGDLGIRFGIGNGIDPGEGYIFGFNLENFSSDITLQVTGVSFTGITASTGEEFTIVNRLDPTKNIKTQANGNNNIADLEVFIPGGTAKLNALSVFHSGTGTGMRINGITFKIRETATLSTETTNNVFTNFFKLNQNPVTDKISINYNTNDVQKFTASLIDLNGRIVQEKNSKTLLSKGKITFDSTRLTAGIYFVKIQEGTKSATLKVIKK